MIVNNPFKSPAVSAGAIRLGEVPSGFAPKFSSALPPGGLETVNASFPEQTGGPVSEAQITPEGLIRIPLTGARLRALTFIRSPRKRAGSL